MQMCSGALLGLLRGPDRPFPEHSSLPPRAHTKGRDCEYLSEFNDLPSLSMIPMGLNQKERCFGEERDGAHFWQFGVIWGTASEEANDHHHQHLVTSREGD